MKDNSVHFIHNLFLLSLHRFSTPIDLKILYRSSECCEAQYVYVVNESRSRLHQSRGLLKNVLINTLSNLIFNFYDLSIEL